MKTGSTTMPGKIIGNKPITDGSGGFNDLTELMYCANDRFRKFCLMRDLREKSHERMTGDRPGRPEKYGGAKNKR